jgi:hypothetical protein
MFNKMAKAALNSLVESLVALQARAFIADHTEIDHDSKLLQVGTSMVGSVVAGTTEPYTDRAVDKVSDWIAAKRNKKTVTAV